MPKLLNETAEHVQLVLHSNARINFGSIALVDSSRWAELWKHQNASAKIKTYRRSAHLRIARHCLQRRRQITHESRGAVRRPSSHCPTTGDGHLRLLRPVAACILSLNDVSSTRSDLHLGTAASIDGGNCVHVVWSTTNELAARGASDVRSGELFESDARRPLVYKPSVSAGRRHKF